MTEVGAAFFCGRTAELEASTFSEGSLETEEVDAKGGSSGIAFSASKAPSMFVFLFFRRGALKSNASSLTAELNETWRFLIPE